MPTKIIITPDTTEEAKITALELMIKKLENHLHFHDFNNGGDVPRVHMNVGYEQDGSIYLRPAKQMCVISPLRMYSKGRDGTHATLSYGFNMDYGLLTLDNQVFKIYLNEPPEDAG